MPLVDMSLEQLKEYKGINPKPADFDEYWDKALKELDTVEPNPELKESEFQLPGAECFDLYFTSVRGARIYAKYIRPRHRTGACPAVLQFHGYSGNSGNWRDLAAWTVAGMCIAAMDCRGQGGKSEDTGGVKGNTYHGQIIRGLDNEDPQDLLFRHIFLDTVQLARVIASMEEVDETRLAATGGSQGGGLTLACAALYPDIKVITPQMPFLTDYLRVWEMDLAKEAYKELKDYFYRFDPRHLREYEIFEKLGYIDVHNLAERIRATTRMYTGLMDTVCPPSTQFAAYNAITAPKSVWVYPDYKHESYPGANDDKMLFTIENL